MYRINIEGSKSYSIEKKGNEIFIDNRSVDYQIIEKDSDSFCVATSSKVYDVSLIERLDKTMTLSVNSKIFKIDILTPVDLLLKKIGIDTQKETAVKEVKAPMPGTVLDVIIHEGDEVKKGDALLILEAMKMENVLKASGNARVKKIHVKNNMNVNKNQVLISFD